MRKLIILVLALALLSGCATTKHRLEQTGSDITWADKQTGSSVTPADFNQIKSAVNSKEDAITCAEGQIKKWGASGWECAEDGGAAAIETDPVFTAAPAYGIIGAGSGSVISSSERIKLEGIEEGAQVNPQSATDQEVTTGTEASVRTFTPAQIKLAAETHGGGGQVNGYFYIAYAIDAAGTGFSLDPIDGLNYVAFLASAIEIPDPQASDFAGLWQQYVGPPGAGITWRGAWSDQVQYTASDAVGYDSKAWIANDTTTGGTPGVAGEWDLWLEGVTGPTGATGDQGDSVELNFSVDGVSWHETLVPATDKYIRFRIGAGSWSSGARFVGLGFDSCDTAIGNCYIATPCNQVPISVSPSSEECIEYVGSDCQTKMIWCYGQDPVAVGAGEGLPTATQGQIALKGASDWAGASGDGIKIDFSATGYTATAATLLGQLQGIQNKLAELETAIGVGGLNSFNFSVSIPTSFPHYSQSNSVGFTATVTDTSPTYAPDTFQWQIGAGGYGTNNFTGVTDGTATITPLSAGSNSIYLKVCDDKPSTPNCQESTAYIVVYDDANPVVADNASSTTHDGSGLITLDVNVTATYLASLTAGVYYDNGGALTGYLTCTGSAPNYNCTGLVDPDGSVSNETFTVTATSLSGRTGNDSIVVTYSASGGQAFSDDFNRANSDNPGTHYTETQGDWDIASNALVWVNNTNYITGLLDSDYVSDTIHQYHKATVVSWGGGAGVAANRFITLMRRAAGAYYDINSTQTTTEWYDHGDNLVQSGSLAFSNGDSRGVVISGTGTSTVVSVFKNPVNNIPYSYGPNCTDTTRACWDSAGDTPDLTFTNNPAIVSDTDKGFAFGAYEHSSATGGNITLDNFYFGDCPE